MAGPFQQAPQFVEYLEWLQRNTRYSYSSGVLPPNVSFIAIFDQNGEVVANLDIPQEERLTPTTIYRLDKLLGVESPYGKTPIE